MLRELKGVLSVVGVLALIIVALFVFTLAQTVHEDREFNNDCRLLSEKHAFSFDESRFVRITSWHCIDNVTYWKRDGIIFDRIGPKGSHPKY